jgi:hypothetical protein
MANLWNQPGGPTTEEWIKKIYYAYTMEYYKAIKKNEIMVFVGKWIEMEIMMNKPRQAQRAEFHVFTQIKNLNLK